MSILLDQTQLNYVNRFNSLNDSLLKEIKDFAVENQIPILEYTSARFIKTLVEIKKPARVLELGTAIAFTTIQIAQLLPEDSFIDTIEKSKNNINDAKRFIAKSGLSGKINLLEGDAADILKKLENKYDLIFLDADKEVYKKLFDLSIGLLNSEGLYIVDNLMWKGFAAAENIPKSYEVSTNHIREFNSYFFNDDRLETSLFPVGDGIGVGIKK